MRQEFELFISGNYTQPVIELMHEAFDLLDEFEVPDYEEQYMTLLMTADNSDTAAVRDDFFAQLQGDLKLILQQHQVKLQDETPMSVYVEVVRALRVLEDWEDKASLQVELEQADPCEERFCNLLELVTPYDATYFMAYVESVSLSLLDKLLEIGEEKSSEENVEGTDQEQLERMVTRLKQMFASETYANCTSALGMIMEGIALGASFLFYANRIHTQLNQLDPELAAREICLCLMMSADGYLNPKGVYQKNSDKLFEDITRITAVDLQLNKLLSRIEIEDKEKLNAAQ
jgi:hypothetical protein